MITITRKCTACGNLVDITEGYRLVIGTQEGTIHICKDCLENNQTFRRAAIQYLLEHADEVYKNTQRKGEQLCKSQLH